MVVVCTKVEEAVVVCTVDAVVICTVETVVVGTVDAVVVVVAVVRAGHVVVPQAEACCSVAPAVAVHAAPPL